MGHSQSKSAQKNDRFRSVVAHVNKSCLHLIPEKLFKGALYHAKDAVETESTLASQSQRELSSFSETPWADSPTLGTIQSSISVGNVSDQQKKQRRKAWYGFSPAIEISSDWPPSSTSTLELDMRHISESFRDLPTHRGPDLQEQCLFFEQNSLYSVPSSPQEEELPQHWLSTSTITSPSISLPRILSNPLSQSIEKEYQRPNQSLAVQTVDLQKHMQEVEKIERVALAAIDACLKAQAITKSCRPLPAPLRLTPSRLRDLQASFTVLRHALGELGTQLSEKYPSLSELLDLYHRQCTLTEPDAFLSIPLTILQDTAPSSGSGILLDWFEHILLLLIQVISYTCLARPNNELIIRTPLRNPSSNLFLETAPSRKGGGLASSRYAKQPNQTRQDPVNATPKGLMGSKFAISNQEPKKCLYTLEELPATSSKHDVRYTPVINFGVLEHHVLKYPVAPIRSLKQNWVAFRAKSSARSEQLTITELKAHVAWRLNTNVVLIRLWRSNTVLTRDDCKNYLSSSNKVDIGVTIDPFIIFQAGPGNFHFVNFWSNPFNKAYAPISAIRHRVDYGYYTNTKPWHFVLGDQVLANEKISLSDTGLLTDRQKQGLDPIVLTVSSSRQKRACMTCLEEQDAEEFLDYVSKKCDHDINTCSDCIRRWLLERLTSKGYDKLNCPECTKTLEYEEVARILHPEEFERYDRLVLHATLSKDPNFRWCLSPTCSSGQVHNPVHPIMTCAACRYKQCTHHNSAWHKGETCADYEDRVSGNRTRRHEAASQQAIEQLSKKCPHCHVNIEKTSGCDHMTCSLCRYEFCWVCLCDWVRASRDAQFHKMGCTYRRTWNNGNVTGTARLPRFFGN